MLQKISVFINVILICLVGYLIFTRKNNDEKEIAVLKQKIENYKSTIDSLRNLKSKEESIVDSFLIIRTEIKKEKEIEIEEIEHLNLDSNVTLLKQNLNEIENYFK